MAIKSGTDVLLYMIDAGSTILIGSQRDATITEDNEVVDASNKSDRNAKGEYGRYGSTISLEHLYVPSNTAQTALKNAARNATKVTIITEEEGTKKEKATAIITSIGRDFPDQEEAVVSVELQVDGGWTTV